MTRIKAGLIGCGTIGTQIAMACQGRLRENIEIFGICDSEVNKTEALNKALGEKVRVFQIDELIKEVDLVIEAASAKISGEVLEKAIRNRRSVLIMSIGGLIGREELLKTAEEKGVCVYLPSGAIAGLDGLKSASVGKIDSVTLTTRKSPKGLEGAPYLKENSIDLKAIKDETVIFDGRAADAVKGFPQNVNVCAVLSLAGIGAERTRVRIVTAPDYTKNIHEIEIRGDAGSVFTRTENLPSSANPKTSALAILSAIATLEGITKNVKIGT